MSTSIEVDNAGVSSEFSSPDGLTGRTPVENPEELLEQAPLIKSVTTYICYLMLIFWGYIADFTRKIGLKVDGANSMMQDVRDVVHVLSLEIIQLGIPQVIGPVGLVNYYHSGDIEW